MGIDLNRAMAEAAERGTAARPGLTPGPVLQRIHRRRAARAATSSAVGLAAVAAVALGGLELSQRTDPPVVPAPAPTTTPSPSPTAPTPSPTPDPEPLGMPLPACGEPADRLASLPSIDAPEPWVQVGVEDAGTGEFLPEGYGDRLLLGFDPAADAGVVSAVVTRDGIVVATYPGVGTGDGQSLELVDCADGSYPGPGDYVLWTATEAADPGSEGEPLLGARHAQVPFTVFEFEDPDNLGSVRWTPQGPVPTDGEEPQAAPGHQAPDPTLLALNAAGLADLPLGSVLDATTTHPLVRWDAAACSGTAAPGRWVASGDHVELADGNFGPPFELRVFEERLVRLDVLGHAVRTAEGLGVGSTLQDVQAAYDVRPLRAVAPGDVVEAWGVVDGERTLVFEVATDAGGVDAWPSALKGTVAAVAVLQGVPYATPAWGTGTCG